VSIELRKVLYRHLANHNQARVFATALGTGLTPRNAVPCWFEASRTTHLSYRRAGMAQIRLSKACPTNVALRTSSVVTRDAPDRSTALAMLAQGSPGRKIAIQ
jgi:hypothetical protein